MLMNRLVCALSTTLLFTFPVERDIQPFLPTEQSIEKQIDLEGMVHKNNLGLIEHPIFVRFEKDKEELEKKKAEEQIKLEQKNNELEWQEFVLTFYTNLSCENSSAGAVTSQGKKLSRGGVANNVIPQNTKIYLDKWGEVVVNDKGSNKHFSVDTRLDVYIERETGESDRQYLRRVNSYGIQKVKGYIIK